MRYLYNPEYVYEGFSKLSSNFEFTGPNVTEEALFGYIFRPNVDGTADIISADLPSNRYTTELGLVDSIDFTETYYVRVFSPTKLALCYKGPLGIKVAVFTHTTSMSNLAKLNEFYLPNAVSQSAVVSPDDKVYYIATTGTDKYVASISLDGTNNVKEVTLPKDLNVGHNLFLDIYQYKIYIFGDISALTEFNIGTKTVDKLQKNLEINKGTVKYFSTLLANGDILYTSTDSDTGILYTKDNDTLTNISITGTSKVGVIRLLAGGVRIYTSDDEGNILYK